jgi:lysozyme family protein
MKDNWDKAIDFVISIEGGYVNDPKDPGGETKYGISKRAYPDVDIANLTAAEARQIYKRDYWDKCSCDDLPDGRDILVFDTAVNMGVGVAMNFLTQSTDWQDYLLYRIDRYIELSRKNANLQKFFRGWIIRCSRLAKLIRG